MNLLHSVSFESSLDFERPTCGPWDACCSSSSHASSPTTTARTPSRPASFFRFKIAEEQTADLPLALQTLDYILGGVFSEKRGPNKNAARGRIWPCLPLRAFPSHHNACYKPLSYHFCGITCVTLRKQIDQITK